MHRHTKSENGDLTSPRSSRAASVSSERTTLSNVLLAPSPMSISPPPAYVAVAAASQIITDQHNASLQDQMDSPESPSSLEDLALFSEDALTLVNSFLDNLLYSILSTARASTLAAIRPAVVEVLKPKLAREAIAAADQELQDLLAGDSEDEQEDEIDPKDKAVLKWDLLKVWKRTRLRVMVYTRLGEMEDEDEENFLVDMDAQEAGQAIAPAASMREALVPWAAAIFLTSVVEHVAEQAINTSGQAAFARATNKRRKSNQSPTASDNDQRPTERVVVGESDVEKIALNSTLGRLWRTWRKRTRSSLPPTSPPLRKLTGRLGGLLHHQPSFDESVMSNEDSRMSMDREIGPCPTESEIAANIPIPVSERDIDEIEVPGLAKQFDDDSDGDGAETPAVQLPQRPHSLLFLSTPLELEEGIAGRRTSRRRPLSLPPPPSLPFRPYSPTGTEETSQVFETPMETAPEGDSYVDTLETPKAEKKLEDTEFYSSADITPIAASPESALNRRSVLVPERSEASTTAQEVSVVDRTVNVQDNADVNDPSKAHRSSSRYSTRSATIPVPDVQQYSDEHGASVYHDDEIHDPEAIGVARTSNVPIPATPSPEPDMFSANINASELQDIPNVEHYLQENDRPESAYLSPAPLVVKRSPSNDVSPIAEGFAPRTSSRNAIIPGVQAGGSHSIPANEVRAASRAQEESNHVVTGRSSAASNNEKGRSRKSIDSVNSSIRQKPRISEEPERASLQRISSGSQSASVGSSILHKTKSSEGSVHRGKAISNNRMSEEDKQREFDSLVQREDTVKYTLTPSSVRQLESSSPVTKVTIHPREQISGPSTPRSPRNVTPTASNQERFQESGPSTAVSSARPPASNSRRPGPAAREPRVQTESMRDFADFIRSTGPNRVTEEVRPILAASPSTKSSLGRRLSSRSRSASGSNNKGSSSDGPTARPRKHLEPRGPSSPPAGNGELIDFIRQGPPASKGGEHRIARTVAPFRTTMDSDDFNNIYNERSLDRSTPPESDMSLSTLSRASVNTNNSRTGLLASSKTTQSNYSSAPQPTSTSSMTVAVPTSSASESGPTITRTRRRVKDPYAIDYSDDEDEDLLTSLPPQRPQRQEESLIDFLRNVEPPAQNEPAPIVTAGPAGRKPLNLNLNGASNSNRGAYDAPDNVRVPPLSPLASHPHTGSSGSYGARNNQRPLGAGRDARPQVLPAGRKTDTSDLADFLRSSGPPEPAPRPTTSASKSSQKAEWRFWKKRTAEV